MCLEHLRTSKDANMAGAEELSGGQGQEVVAVEGGRQYMGHGLEEHSNNVGLSLGERRQPRMGFE